MNSFEAPAGSTPEPSNMEAQAPGERDPHSLLVDQISAEETEKRTPEMLRLVTRGIGDLFELLPKSAEPTKEDVVKLIEHTDLNIMLPGMREKFAKEIDQENILKVKDKAEFIGRSLETEAIKMFVNLEAMKAGTGATLARLREAQSVESATDDEREARLEELRREILG